MSTTIKICGLSTAETLDAALTAGADMVGFVCFDKSPRNVSTETARSLSERAGGRALRVVLTVDADDAALSAVATLKPDMLQLHGRETPERVAAIRARFGIKVMKAIAVAESGDLAQVALYEPVTDMLLFDAKAPPAAVIPGGNGLSFDWRLVRDLRLTKPWLLAGGLDPGNVGQALAVTGAPGVDVSSGVETAPGIKDIGRINAFIDAVRATEKLGSRRRKS